MNSFQKERHNAAVKAHPYLKLLDKKLLSLGGDTVVLWNSDVTTQEVYVMCLLGVGRVTSRKYPKRYQAETGYALSEDGCWRPHGWVWDILKNCIVETTVPRKIYFGFTETL
jgi:hypothetical protein